VTRSQPSYWSESVPVLERAAGPLPLVPARGQGVDCRARLQDRAAIGDGETEIAQRVHCSRLSGRDNDAWVSIQHRGVPLRRYHPQLPHERESAGWTQCIVATSSAPTSLWHEAYPLSSTMLVHIPRRQRLLRLRTGAHLRCRLACTTHSCWPGRCSHGAVSTSTRFRPLSPRVRTVL